MSASPASSKHIDWSGQWFQLLQDAGEDVFIRVGVERGVGTAADDDGDDDSADFADFALRSHVDFDGLGAVVDVLRAGGVDVDVFDGTVPRASLLTTARAALRFALDTPRHVDWWPRRPATTTLPLTATRLLSVDETRALVQAARAAGGTVTTLLLSRLATALAPSLTTPADAQPWMVPVNLRGRVRRPRHPGQRLGNTVGFLTLSQTTTSTAATTQAALTAALSSGEAQATWWLNQIGRLVGRRGMRAILQSATSSGYKNVGNFSNLGVLNVKDAEALDGGGVFFLPPVARSQSCAFGAVTVAGRLSLSCVLHPTVSIERAVMRSWLRSVA